MTFHTYADGHWPVYPPPIPHPYASLLLDFDGTLVELADRPDGVIVDAPLKILLQHLSDTLQGRVVIVSGRSIEQLSHFLGDYLNHIGCVGSHGAEVQIGNQRISPLRPPALIDVEQAMLSIFGPQEGVIIEPKAYGVALHYRLAPEAEKTAHAFAEEMARATGLMIQKGKMMVELRSADCDKGTGIETIMSLHPFRGTKPIFLGDDITDEAGFATVEKLGGYGILVGAARPSKARYNLDNVAAVRAWLGKIK